MELEENAEDGCVGEGNARVAGTEEGNECVTGEADDCAVEIGALPGVGVVADLSDIWDLMYKRTRNRRRQSGSGLC